MTQDYTIAGFRLRIQDFDLLQHNTDSLWAAFSPFGSASGDEPAPSLVFQPARRLPVDVGSCREINRFVFADLAADCIFSRCEEGYLFTMAAAAHAPVHFFKPHGSNTALSDITLDEPAHPSLLRFGLWFLLALSINPLHAAPVHSSVIVYRNEAVCFLGESGTGKSTHTRLWRKHIPHAVLLNDDSPIVRFDQDVPTAYGSPWSGKTPCYINRSFPIRAFVRLSQAPANRIERLSAIKAFGALLPSCPPAFAYDDSLQDNTCDMLSKIISRTPVYALECLPDADAAQLAYKTIFG